MLSLIITKYRVPGLLIFSEKSIVSFPTKTSSFNYKSYYMLKNAITNHIQCVLCAIFTFLRFGRREAQKSAFFENKSYFSTKIYVFVHVFVVEF